MITLSSGESRVEQDAQDLVAVEPALKQSGPLVTPAGRSGNSEEQTGHKDAEVRQQLLQRIQARRVSITAFVRDLERQGRRLLHLHTICTAVVIAFMAPPGLGGPGVLTRMQQWFALPTLSSVWQPLCLAALLLSIVAIMTTRYTSHIAKRLRKAEACDRELEALEALVESGQIPVSEAEKRYQQYVTEIRFIQAQPVVLGARSPT